MTRTRQVITHRDVTTIGWFRLLTIKQRSQCGLPDEKVTHEPCMGNRRDISQRALSLIPRQPTQSANNDFLWVRAREFHWQFIDINDAEEVISASVLMVLPASNDRIPYHSHDVVISLPPKPISEHSSLLRHHYTKSMRHPYNQ